MSPNILFEKIVEGITNHKVIPFFGAGMSKPLGLKDWSQLTADLKNELGTDVDGNLRVAQAYEDKFGRERLIQKLKANYTIKDITNLPADNHRLVLSMAPPIVYTTNYDDALELSAEAIGRPYYKVASLQHVVDMPHKANLIVKFHGDFSEGSEIVLTENDYEKRMSIQHPLDILFRAHLLGKSIFFMGYGMNDKNIDLFFDMHSDLYGAKNLPISYLVTFSKPDKDREAILRKRNIEVIFMESPSHLHDTLRSINGQVFNGDYKKQIETIFASSPQKILLRNELENLEEFWVRNDHPWLEKADKLERSLSLRLIPADIQLDVASFLISIVEDQAVSNEAIDIVLRTLFWTDLHSENTFQLALAITTLTEREYYRRGDGLTVQDPLQIVEKLLKDKGTVLCLFAYLVRSVELKKRLAQDQINEIIYVLRACKYDEIDFGPQFPIEEREAILSETLKHYPGWKPLNTPFRMSSFNQINDMMLGMLPKE